MTKKTNNKYRAVRSGAFDSQAERQYAGVLELLKRSGEIVDYKHHPPKIVLRCMVTWRPDFMVWDKNGDPFYVEVKSPITYKLHAFKNLVKLLRYESEEYGDLPTIYVVQKYAENKFKNLTEIVRTFKAEKDNLLSPDGRKGR